MQRSLPLYLDCGRTQALTAWCGVIANALQIVWLAIWLIARVPVARPQPLGLCVAVLTALFIADFFSGLVHWATDTWFDEANWQRLISIAREHHTHPHHIIGYPFRDYVAFSSWPAVLIIAPCGLLLTLAVPPTLLAFDGVVLCLVISSIMFFGTYAHRLGHRPSQSRIVRLLQACHLLITTSHHGVHHRGNHNSRYCVVNGWANYVCDAIRFWRVLEWLVASLTGAVPRRSDVEWLARFRRR